MRIDTRVPGMDRSQYRHAVILLDGNVVDKGLCFLADDVTGEVGLFEDEGPRPDVERSIRALRTENGEPVRKLIKGKVEIRLPEKAKL